MTGPIFAVLTSICFGLNSVFIRRAVLRVPDASIGTLISVPMGIPFFLLILSITHNLRSILGFSWHGYFWLSLAGVLHFVVGRSLSYKCIKLVGANIASIFRRVNIIVAVVIGVSLLNEPLSWDLAVGVFLIITGITIPGFNYGTLDSSYGGFSKIPKMAWITGFGCGVAWGLSPIFIRVGLSAGGSPIAGALISFSAGSAILSMSLLNMKRRSSFSTMSGRAVLLFFLGGVFSLTAHLFRYTALGLASVSVVAPIVSTSPVFTLLLSFFFNRKVEFFSAPVIIGTIMVVVGTIVII